MVSRSFLFRHTIVCISHSGAKLELYKNHRIQLLPLEHNAYVEGIAEFETTIAQTFLYPRQGLYKNHRIQLLPIERNAHVEDIAESETAIAQTFLYPRQFLLLFNSSANLRQWLHISSGSGNNLYWQWELILPVGTLNLAVGRPCSFYSQHERVDTSDDTVMDDESNQGRMITKMDKDDLVVLMDDKEDDKKVKEAKVDESAQEDETEPAKVQKVVDVVTTAKLITKVVTAASETVTAASVIIPTAEPQVPAATLTAAPVRVAAAPSKRRKGVIIRDPKEESTTSTIILAETKSKDKGKGILVEEPKPLKKKQQIKQDEQFARKKPQTEAQARKNMMMYLKNVVGFKLDYFKGMSYDDICLIFEAKFNSNVDFLLKKKEQMEEEEENKALQTINETPTEKAAKMRKLNEEVEDLKIHLQIVPNEDDDVYTEATPLARKVSVVDYEIIEMNNKPYYKIIIVDGTHQLYISFLTLLILTERIWRLYVVWLRRDFQLQSPRTFLIISADYT
nr:hypothetical protein [Tanacetum cinerariifolium]